MQIQANVDNERGRHSVLLKTNQTVHSLSIAPRESGFGSLANGGELLCLAMATCYCNDIYREAAKRAIEVVRVNVEASAEFGAPGAPACGLSYSVTVFAKAPEAEILDLIRYTDSMAEIQNTLRQGVPVVLDAVKAVCAGPADAP
jgi:organic hydroperoxide reductase OsmC/OhrA